VPYLGAAPQEVEQGVCIRIEEELEGIEGVKQIRSNANEGLCTVSVELFDDTDRSKALDDVSNRIDAIDTFPTETEKPIVNLVTVIRAVLDIAVTGPTDERTLKVVGQQVRDDMAKLPGVTQVELRNTRPYEVSIEVSETSLRRHGLSFDDVAQAVRTRSLDLPGGSIKTGSGEILLRAMGQAYWGEEYEDLVLRTQPDGTRLYLKDVATVVDGFADTDQMLRFDGKPAALIRVSRIGSQDIMDITKVVRGYLATSASRIPEGVTLTVWNDGSRLLQDRLETLLNSARQGFLMVLILLALFLQPRLAFWVSVGVPVAFLGAIFATFVLGLSIDVISLFGFILVLGILVDDAIVVGENVHANQQRLGDPMKGAIVGTQQVSIPVIFGVLTTIATFTPLLLGPGTFGQIFGVIATVVMCCLTFSLIESQLILPSHLSSGESNSATKNISLLLLPIVGITLLEFAWDWRSYIALAIASLTVMYLLYLVGLLTRSANRLVELQEHFSGSVETLINTRFRRLVERAVKFRYVTAAIAIAAFMSAIAIVGSGRLPFSFFPPLDSDQSIAQLSMPLGTPASITNAAVLHLERTAQQLAATLAEEYPDNPPVTHVLSAVGSQPSSSSGGGPGSSGSVASGGYLGEVTLQLVPSQERLVSTREVTNRWRDLAGPIADAVELKFTSSLFTAGNAIDVQLEGDNVDELKEIATQLRGKLAEYPGVIDITDSFRSGKQEIKLAILPSGEALGLTLSQLARQVRQAFYGEEAQRIQRGRDDVRVMVRYTKNERQSLSALKNMRIRTADGSEVPFQTVATAELGQGFSTIRRSDRQRIVNVVADIDRSQITANEVIRRLGAGPIQDIMQNYPRVTYRLEGEQAEQGEAVGSLVPMFGIALFVIFALLAVPLKSYSQPLIIMSVIPFAFAGAMWGHQIMKLVGQVSGLSFPSVMGFIAASGVVVNSSLVLVHNLNARRNAGEDVMDAVIHAAVTRCRPIVLTSLTTFAGLLPLMFNKSVQAQFLIPMAVSLAFGVMFATVVTLLLVPSSYMIFEDLHKLRRRTSTPAPNS
jgi:multidrug efflux pump subunit AcrB